MTALEDIAVLNANAVLPHRVVDAAAMITNFVLRFMSALCTFSIDRKTLLRVIRAYMLIDQPFVAKS